MKLKIFFIALFVLPMITFSFSLMAYSTGCAISGMSDTDCDLIVDNIDNCDMVRNGPCTCPELDSNGNCVFSNQNLKDNNLIYCDIDGNGELSEKEFKAGNQANWNLMEPLDNGGDACEDFDDDNRRDYIDNCKLVANSDQADYDKNGEGDLCQDTDEDGILDYYKAVAEDGSILIFKDNCVEVWNPVQQDRDKDERGDACDVCPLDEDDLCTDDRDMDGISDSEDNCELIYNPDQKDTDEDDVGDKCDNCVETFNPEQTDTDENRTGDACQIAKDENPPADITEERQGGGGCNLNSGSSLIGLLILIPLMLRRRK